MKIKWCGVFRNTGKNARYPPYYAYVDYFFGPTAAEIKLSIKAFVEELGKRGMQLVDKEILDVID